MPLTCWTPESLKAKFKGASFFTNVVTVYYCHWIVFWFFFNFLDVIHFFVFVCVHAFVFSRKLSQLGSTKYVTKYTFWLPAC